MLLVLPSFGCRLVAHESCSTKILSVFEGFEYAGRIPSLRQLNMVTVEREVTKPTRFEAGSNYVFYHRQPLRNFDMETVTIPARLSAHGFQFKPIGELDLGYPDAGGPLFSLDFSGPCKGDIINVVDHRIMQNRDLSHIWASEAYIIRFTADCS